MNEDMFEKLVEGLASLSDNAAYKANFTGTPERLKKYYDTFLSDDQMQAVIAAELLKTFPVELDEGEEQSMLFQGPIVLNSLCPHHLLPVRYHMYLAILPQAEYVLGLSKYARIAQALATRPTLQEQLTQDICSVLYQPAKSRLFKKEKVKPVFSSEGSAVTLIGTHSCMCCRGVQSDARTTTTSRRGIFQGEQAEQKFYQAINITRNNNPFGS